MHNTYRDGRPGSCRRWSVVRSQSLGMALRATTLGRVAGFTFALAVLFPGWLWSQPPTSLHNPASVGVGDRVRITASDVWSEPLIGWVDRVEGANLVLAGTEMGTLVTVPIGNIEKLELQVARRTRRKGAQVGLVVGTLVGFVGALAVVSGDDQFATPGAAVGGVFFGAVGGLLGAGIGAGAAGDGWDVVPTDRILAGTTATRRLGFGVSLGIGGPR